jgi:hypothetical protein
VFQGIPCGENKACLKDVIPFTGLGIAGQGDATLVDAEVLPQIWSPDRTQVDASYGGLVGLAAHYRYRDDQGQSQIFTAYIEYEHLITAGYLPRRDQGDFVDEQNQKIDPGAYSGCRSFGGRMVKGVLSAADLAQHPLIGFLGATQTPHVHIQAAFSSGKVGYAHQRFFDPSVLLAH